LYLLTATSCTFCFSKEVLPDKISTTKESLSPESIQSKINHAEKNKNLDEETRTKLIETYHQAMEQTHLTDEWIAKSKIFEKEKETAPFLLKSLKKKLDTIPSRDIKFNSLPDASLTQLEQMLSQAQTEWASIQKEADDLQSEPKRLSDRRIEIPDLITRAKRRLEEIDKDLAGFSDELSETDNARKMLLLAQKINIQEEMKAYDKEILTYETKNDLILLRRDYTSQQLILAEKKAKFIQELVNDRRKKEAETAVQQAREARLAVTTQHPVIHALAEENAQLAELRTGSNGLTARIETISHEFETIDSLLNQFHRKFKSITEKIDTAGFTNAIGLLLQKQRTSFPDIRIHQKNIQTRQNEISQIQLRQLEMEDQRASLSNIEENVQHTMSLLGINYNLIKKEYIESTIRELWKTRKNYLDSLINDYNTYFVKLIELDSRERQLVSELSEDTGFINEHVLWIRSSPILDWEELTRAKDTLEWLLHPKEWIRLTYYLWTDIRTNPWIFILAVLFFSFLFKIKKQLRAKLETIGDAMSPSAPFIETVKAVLLTLAMAWMWPSLVLFISWRLTSFNEMSELGKMIGDGLKIMTILYLTIEIFRQIYREKGLAETHFRWPGESIRFLRKAIFNLMIIGLPLSFIVSFMEFQSSEIRKDSLGRIAFILLLALLAFFMHQLLRPDGILLRNAIKEDSEIKKNHPFIFWYLFATGTPLLLIVISFIGYYYTAVQLAWRLLATVWLFLGVTIINAFILRWLFIARRNLALRQVEKRRAVTASVEMEGKSGGDSSLASSSLEVNLSAINLQTRKLLKYIVQAALILGIYLVWAKVLPAIGILRQIELWTVFVNVYEKTATGNGGALASHLIQKAVPVTLIDLILAIAVFLITLAANKNIPGLLEITLLQRFNMEHGGRYAIVTISKYLIMIIGLTFSLSILGISWSGVQWLVAAMTVGLGFGLQEIFANFVSGLIILFERPIRVGDTVTVGDTIGTVSKIWIRATTITDMNRRELVVPNKEFITGKIVNWTLSDNILRIVVPIGVSYKADPEAVRQCLLTAAKNNSDILKDPEPTALFTGFGDNALQFELLVYVSVEHYHTVRHELHTAIFQLFQEQKIDIPFPQREIYLHSDVPVSKN
jgi:potassium-dependent mechanosensitive channel